MRSPTTGLLEESSAGTETPTLNPLMISPRSREWEASSTKPVGSGNAVLLIWLPSMITRSLALLPSLASIVFGIDWM